MNVMNKLMLFTVAICIAIVFIIFLIKKGGKKVKDIKTYWDIPMQTCRNREDTKGVFFGYKDGKFYYSKEDDEGHICAFGGTGTGKTSSFLINTLKKWNSGSFVIDISGDIEKNTDMPNKIVYAPNEKVTIPYYIFYFIDEEKDQNERDGLLNDLALLLIPEAKPNDGEASRYFISTGRRILQGAFLHYYNNYNMDFIEICEEIVSKNYKKLFDEIKEGGYKAAMQKTASLDKVSSKNISGAYDEIIANIDVFISNYKIKNSIRRPTKEEFEKGEYFSPNQIETKNVFVNLPDKKLKPYQGLVRIIIAQSFDFFSGRAINSKSTLLFCIDEFASFGKLEMQDALQKFRKNKIRVFFLTQSVKNVDLIYGKDERDTFLNNCSYTIALSATDEDTSKYFSFRTGTKKVNGRDEENVKPHEWDRLKKNCIVFYRGNYIKLKKVPYYKKIPIEKFRDFISKFRKQIKKEKIRELKENINVLSKENENLKIKEKLKLEMDENEVLNEEKDVSLDNEDKEKIELSMEQIKALQKNALFFLENKCENIRQVRRRGLKNKKQVKNMENFFKRANEKEKEETLKEMMSLLKNESLENLIDKLEQYKSIEEIKKSVDEYM